MRRNRLAAGLAIALGLVGFGIWVGPATGEESDAPIACGAPYEVGPGDTLVSIAIRAYGTDDTRILLEANRDVLSGPALLFVGQSLVIPCRDGARSAQGTDGIQPAPAGDPGAGQPVGPGTEPRGAAQSRQTARDRGTTAQHGAAAQTATFQPTTSGPRPVLTTEIVPRPPGAGPAGGRAAATSGSGRPAAAAGAQPGAGETGAGTPTATRRERAAAGAGVQPAAGAQGPGEATRGVQPPAAPARRDVAAGAAQPAPGNGPAGGQGARDTGQSGSDAGGAQPAVSARRATLDQSAASGRGSAAQPAPGRAVGDPPRSDTRNTAATGAGAALQPPASGRRRGDAAPQPAPTPRRDPDRSADREAVGGGAAPSAQAAAGAAAQPAAAAAAGGAQPAPAAARGRGADMAAATRTGGPAISSGAAGADPLRSGTGPDRRGGVPARDGTGTQSASAPRPDPAEPASTGDDGEAPDPTAASRSADAAAGPRVRPLPRTDRIPTPQHDADPGANADGAARVPTDGPDERGVSLAALDPAPRNAREPRTQGETDLRAPEAEATTPDAMERRRPAAEPAETASDAADNRADDAARPARADRDGQQTREAARSETGRRAVFGLPDGAGPVTTRSPQSMQPAPGGVQPLPSVLPTAADAGEGEETETDGGGTRLARTAAADAAEPAAPAGTAPPVPATGEPVRILSAAMAPYAGEALPGRGMLAEMATRALGHAAPGRAIRISFVGDRRLHLGVLLPDGAYDIGLPWLKPDCARPGRLSPDLRRRCTEFLWSEPLQEIMIGYFVAAGSPLRAAVAPADLAGRRLCRPAGQPRLDLSQNGLVAGRVTVVAGRDLADCLDRLLAGAVDVVTMSVGPVEAEIARRGLADRVEEIPALADRHSLHALAARGSPKGRAALTLIDRGLAILRDTGEWFDVVAKHRSDPAPAN